MHLILKKEKYSLLDAFVVAAMGEKNCEAKLENYSNKKTELKIVQNNGIRQQKCAGKLYFS